MQRVWINLNLRPDIRCRKCLFELVLHLGLTLVNWDTASIERADTAQLFEKYRELAGTTGRGRSRISTTASYARSTSLFACCPPNQVIRADDLARAMLDVAIRCAGERRSPVFENHDIRAIVESLQFPTESVDAPGNSAAVANPTRRTVARHSPALPAHRHTVTTSPGACRAPRATDFRSRCLVGVRALTDCPGHSRRAIYELGRIR